MSSTARLVAIGLLAGCFSKPADRTGGGEGVADAAIDSRNLTDAPSPPRCNDNPFSALEPAFSSPDSGEPTITGDLKEIYFTKDVGGQQYVIFYAKRTSTTGAFSVQGQAISAAPNIAPDPSITADGLLLVFRFDGGMGERAYFSTRTDTSMAPWSAPAPLAGLESPTMDSLDISPDGLTLYFNSSGFLQRATRLGRGDDFTIQPDPGLGGEFRFPTVSSDGLELYYNDSPFIKRVTRTSTTMGFGSAPTEVFGTDDPDLSADGTTIVVSSPSHDGVQMATRSCN